MGQSNTQSEAVALTFFKLLDSDDFDGMHELLADDAAWLAQAVDLPGAGEIRGNTVIVDELLKPYSALFTTLPSNSIISMASNGDLVLVETRAKGILRDGRAYENRYAWAIEVRGGKIAVIREYLDSHYVARMLGLEPISEIALTDR